MEPRRVGCDGNAAWRNRQVDADLNSSAPGGPATGKHTWTTPPDGHGDLRVSWGMGCTPRGRVYLDNHPAGRPTPTATDHQRIEERSTEKACASKDESSPSALSPPLETAPATTSAPKPRVAGLPSSAPRRRISRVREASPLRPTPPAALRPVASAPSPASGAMQLYHHPYSLDSQKVRIALEEKGIDYTSYHVNPLTGKNMNVDFFRMNPSAKLPVFQNGAHVIYRAIDIIQYLDRLAVHLSGEIPPVNNEVHQWMQKVDAWNPKMFTLTHTPVKYRSFVSKFIRRVLIARMAEAPDLASMYHVKLREAYEAEDKAKDPDIMKQSEEELSKLLDDVEAQLNKNKHLAGDEFTPADSMFVPILARITLLDLDDEYISCRPRILEYYTLVKQRPSYKVTIGKYFNGWKKYQTLFKTSFFLCVRTLFRKY